VSLFFGRQKRFYGITGAADLIPTRPTARVGSVTVTSDTALRHSAVWACLRLRASLMSTFPIDVFRRIGGVQVRMPKPPVLTLPGAEGPTQRIMPWMYASQFDLDRSGNAIGLIVERNALGLPARIELQPLAECSVRVKNGVRKYRIANKEYDPRDVWHEVQYPVAGLPMGLSPIAQAALSIGEYMSIQQFALDWYGGGAVPKARLRNAARTLKPNEASDVKDRWKASVTNGDLFVTGNDWEYDMIQSQQMDMAWLEAKRYSATDIGRFFGVPGDLIDAVVSGQSVTYASLTEKNLQFLILHMGPPVVWREDALSTLLPRPRYVKLNTDALLRMDPKSRAEMFQTQIDARILAPSEARELDNRPPFTDDQIAEFETLFAAKRSNAQPTGVAT